MSTRQVAGDKVRHNLPSSNPHTKNSRLYMTLCMFVIAVVVLDMSKKHLENLMHLRQGTMQGP